MRMRREHLHEIGILHAQRRCHRSFPANTLANLRVSPGSCDLCALYQWNIFIRIEFMNVREIHWHGMSNSWAKCGLSLPRLEINMCHSFVNRI